VYGRRRVRKGGYHRAGVGETKLMGPGGIQAQSRGGKVAHHGRIKKTYKKGEVFRSVRKKKKHLEIDNWAKKTDTLWGGGGGTASLNRKRRHIHGNKGAGT